LLFRFEGNDLLIYSGESNKIRFSVSPIDTSLLSREKEHKRSRQSMERRFSLELTIREILTAINHSKLETVFGFESKGLSVSTMVFALTEI